jgi:MFS family permease
MNAKKQWRIFTEYKGLPREVYILFFARLINSAGWFVFPFLTFYMTQKLNMSADISGLFLMIIAALQGLGSVIGGKLTDRMGRKAILLIFQTLSALIFGVCGFLGETILVPYLLMVASFCGSIAFPANGAIVTDLTTPQNRQQAMSLLYLGMNIGVAAGHMAGGFLFENLTRWLFWGDMITSLIALSLVLVFVKDTLPDQEAIEAINESGREGERAVRGGIIRALLQRPFLLAFCLITILLSFIYRQVNYTIPQHMSVLFGTNGAIYFGTMMTVNALVVVFFTTPLMVATRKIRPVYNVTLAAITYAIGFGMLFFEVGIWWFFLSTVIWTIGEIISSVNIGVYVANHSPVTHRGRFNSIYNLIQGIGGALAPGLTGLFIASNGVRWAWPLVFGLAIMAIVGFCILGKIETRVLHRTEQPGTAVS